MKKLPIILFLFISVSLMIFFTSNARREKALPKSIKTKDGAEMVLIPAGEFIKGAVMIT